MSSGSKFAAVMLVMFVGSSLDSPLSGSGRLSDEITAEHVQRQFRTNVALRDSEIQVQASSGIVTLEGAVKTLVEKQRAEYLSRLAPGVKEVVNNLQVGRESDSPRSISLAIERMFAADPQLHERKLHANAQNRIVRLTGAVGSLYEKSQAERLARQVPGVEIIRNELRIELQNDDELRGAVLDAFESDRRLDSLLVDVNVAKQIVTLQGYVESPDQRDLAEIHAGTIPGVRGVDNRLVVAYWPGPNYR